MQPLDVFDQVGFAFRLELTVRTFDQLGQMNFPDVVPQISHRTRRILANRTAEMEIRV